MRLVDRVIAILTRPKEEWRVIEQEPADLRTLFGNYLAILALIPAIAGFIGTTIVGMETIRGPIKLSFMAGLLCALYSYALLLATVYIAALVTDWLAPRYGGRRDFGSALKLSVYSNTPYCLAGIALVSQQTSVLIMLGLYAMVLFFLGAPVLMKSRRSIGYPVLMFVIVFVLVLPLGAIQALLWF